jgi:hypothetical protein
MMPDWLDRALAEEEPYRLLQRSGLECGFGDGGCRILAGALQRVLGGDLYAVYRDSGVMDHVVLRLGEEYLDVDGLHSVEGVLANARTATAGGWGLTLGRFEAARADDSGIPYDEDVTAALAEYLRGRLPQED